MPAWLGGSGLPWSVLIVEDDQALRDLLAEALPDFGLLCDTARDGNEALRKLEERPFDAVLLDVLMPDKEGIETLVEIKRGWPATKVIIVSGGGRMRAEEVLELAGSFGADESLRKPVTPTVIAATIDRLLATPV